MEKVLFVNTMKVNILYSHRTRSKKSILVHSIE